MQKMLAVLCTLAALFVLWVGAGLMVLHAVKAANAPAQSTKAQYVLKSRSGRAVLYAADGSEVAQYAVRVSLLPEADKKRLENGIEIDSREALSSVLEDLGI